MPTKRARKDTEPTGRMVTVHGHEEWRYDDPALNDGICAELDQPPRVPSTDPAVRHSHYTANGITYHVEDHGPPVPEPYQPVALRTRQDGWTAERQRRFLDTLAATGSVTRSADAVGLSVRAVYRLRNHPQGAAFARAMDAAQMVAANRLIGIAFERATTGTSRKTWRRGELVAETTPPSDQMLMFLLRHLSPDLFGPDFDPAYRLGRIEAAQAGFADALAGLTDCPDDAGADDPGARYPAMPSLDRG